MERVKIPNSKGQGIAAVIHRPEATTTGLAILCPGYLDTKDYKHLVGHAEALCSQGYTVVRFDPTGTWESEGDISDYTTTQYLADVKSVLEHMLHDGEYEHILLGGHSRGGQVSLLYAANDPRISTVLAIMPASRPVTGERRHVWEEAGASVGTRELPDDPAASREFHVPFTHVLDRDQYDTYEEVKKINAHTIYIVGELDILSPPEDVQKVFDCTNEPKEFIVAMGIDHEYRHRPKEIEEINRLLLQAVS